MTTFGSSGGWWCRTPPEHLVPGFVVFPEWWGPNDYATHRAEQLARQGYVAFVADMYGDGATTADAAQAAQWAGRVLTSPASRARAVAALTQLRSSPMVDGHRVAAIGFCFGGSIALELARSGADLRAIAAFHAGLATSQPATRESLRARVLVLHGAADPHVAADDIHDFQAEMTAANADWHMASYGGAVHSFSNPAADKAGLNGVAYDERAARRSWRLMLDFLTESFAH